MTDTYSKAAVGYERIQEILQTENEVRDLRGARTVKKLKGKIEFESVCFSYTPEQPIIRDISFCIEAGEVTALVGPAGVGKTTNVSPGPRSYCPGTGTRKIDGPAIKRFKKQSYAAHISNQLPENVRVNT